MSLLYVQLLLHLEREVTKGRHSAPQVLAEGRNNGRIIHTLLEKHGIVYGRVETGNMEVCIRYA